MENYYQSDDLKQNYIELKSKLETVFKKVKQTADLKHAKSLLIEVQRNFKVVKLNRAERDELYSKLQTAFDEVNLKIEKERSEIENEAARNFITLKTKIEDAEFMANHPKEYRESFNFLIEVQNEFRGLKLQREQRELLYGRLQKAFEILKNKQITNSSTDEIRANLNIAEITNKVDEICRNVEYIEDFYEAKDQLINIQAELKSFNLSRELKDEFFTKIQDAFTIINLKREEDIKKISEESDLQFSNFKNRIIEIEIQTGNNKDLKSIKEQLKGLQYELRDLNLTREHRKELFDLIQQNFEKVIDMQDKESGYFRKESQENYNSLKELVDKGFKQAENSHEYKETREFLKKIQSEFKGIKLKTDEREELYSKLQKAFEILNTRVDEYFHTRKKNWEVRMQYKISEMISEIENLEDEIEAEKETLLGLEDQLDIIVLSGKETIALDGLKARIASAKTGILKKIEKIDELEDELQKLEERVNGSSSENEDET